MSAPPPEGGEAGTTPAFVWDLGGVPAAPIPEIPDHELLGPLGEGGMGVVYRARHTSLGREVAVKVLPVDRMTERARRRFLREAQLLARLRHPNVLAVHASGETPNICYLVTELVDGQHLDVACRDAPLERRLDLLCELAEAVAVLHAAGITHRDLKPANILVTDEGCVKVIDFGVSTGEDVSRLTSTGNFVGTPIYAAPECFGGLQSGAPPADVWSLGVVAYELLAGAHPFAPEERINLTALVARMQGPLTPLNEKNPQVPAEVAAVVARALDCSRKTRTPDAEAFLEDLREAWAAQARPSLMPPLVGAAGLVLAATLLILARPGELAPSPAAGAGGGAAPVVSAGTASVDTQVVTPASLARSGRWAELRENLTEGPATPERARLLGLAALYLEGPEAAAGQLDPEDPALEHARVLAAARADLRREDSNLRVVFGHSGRLVEGLRACPEDGVARPEAARRSVAWLLDALRVAVEVPARFGPLTDEELVLASDALLPFSERPAQVRLQRVVALHGWGLSQDPPRLELLERASAEPVDDCQGALADRLRFVVGLLRSPKRAPSAGLRARAQASVAEPRAEGLAHEHILRRCRAGLALADRDEGIALLRQGQTARGRALLGRALEHARALNRLANDVPLGRFERLTLACLELTWGDPNLARALLERMPSGLTRDYLLCECELVQGSPEALRPRLRDMISSYGRGLQRRVGLSYLRVHRNLSEGVFSAERALERLERLQPPKQRLNRFCPSEWHTREGLRAVLKGGWWPGRKR